MDFYYQAGKAALGSRMRRLSERLTEDAAKIYSLYHVPLEPRWFPVFFCLMDNDAIAITELAKTVDQTHPAVSQVIREMKKKGLVTEKKDKLDGRRTLVSLSAAGKEIAPRLREQIEDVVAGVEDLMQHLQYNLWKAIEETEYQLAQQSLYERVHRIKKERGSRHIEIVGYEPALKQYFEALNREWIEKYFKMEEKDEKSLSDPEAYIIAKGGHIFFARYKGEVAGVCALLKLEDGSYELAKMAVSPQYQGNNIGYLLGKAVIAKARELKAGKLWLESNTILTPALKLYEKLGFKKIIGQPSPYERCNIQMEMDLN